MDVGTGHNIKISAVQRSDVTLTVALDGPEITVYLNEIQVKSLMKDLQDALDVATYWGNVRMSSQNKRPSTIRIADLGDSYLPYPKLKK